MIIDLPLDEFENRVAALIEGKSFGTLYEEVVAGAQWLEEHPGNPVKDDWEKMNNFTSLVCQIASILRLG